MFEAVIAVVGRYPAIEKLVDVDFSASEAEATCLLRDLEAAAFPLHDVIFADHVFMDEAAMHCRFSGSRARQ